MERAKPQLGAGLIGIGREWGHVKTAVPTESEALLYLNEAYNLGVRFFDTAPSYGTSEERLGIFLHSLSPEQRAGITVATKFGEHWNDETQEPYTDHSYEALTASIDQSIARLGIPDVLLVHKTSPGVLANDDLRRAIEYAKAQGIKEFGASVSDTESARIVIDCPDYSYIQFPYNTSKTDFSDIIDLAHSMGKKVVINRPFNMGASIQEVSQTGESPHTTAYRFVAQRLKEGDVALTGTKSPKHLHENIVIFQSVLE